MFMSFVMLLTSLASLVSALPLATRDVADPPITSPTAGTVWHVGDKPTVTWSTANLPVNITNPNGMLVLGYMYNNSENLMLNSPLATNINYTWGQVQITVPDVPTREDYIVVLFGDSGNASPQFTIINDASSSVAPSSSATTSSSPSTSPASSAPASSAPSPSSPGSSPPDTTPSSPTVSVMPTATAPALAQSTMSSQASVFLTSTVSTSPSPTQTNAAWQKYALSTRVGTCLSVGLALLHFAL